MASYYILQPLRDMMGVKNVDKLPHLFIASMVIMLLANPIFGTLVARLPRSRFIPIVYRFFLLNLIGFYFLLSPAGALKTWGQLFFLWVSIFNLFTISVFWGFVADVFTSEQGKRLFGFIGAGGTIGQLAGSLLTDRLAVTVGPV